MSKSREDQARERYMKTRGELTVETLDGHIRRFKSATRPRALSSTGPLGPHEHFKRFPGFGRYLFVDEDGTEQTFTAQHVVNISWKHDEEPESEKVK